MRLEEVLPALREGKKIRRKRWSPGIARAILGAVIFDTRGSMRDFCFDDVTADDWEVVLEPTRVADYLVPIIVIEGWFVKNGRRYERQTHPVGQQPEGAVMVPGSERET